MIRLVWGRSAKSLEAADNRSELGAVTDQLEAAQAEIARLGKALSDESFIALRLDAEVTRLVRQNNVLNARVDAAIAENARQAGPVELTACVCGGDAELHLRRQIVAAEQRALRDRANAVVLDNRLALAEGRPVIRSLT